MPTTDVGALTSAPEPAGVRLLPPRDPYTQMRDRGTVVDPQHHAAIWRRVGEPGTVLARGRIVGTWRPRKGGRTLTITVTTFDPLPAADGESLRTEAAAVGRLRGASRVHVVIDEP
jgi:hypothetical protein